MMTVAEQVSSHKSTSTSDLNTYTLTDIQRGRYMLVFYILWYQCLKTRELDPIINSRLIPLSLRLFKCSSDSLCICNPLPIFCPGVNNPRGRSALHERLFYYRTTTHISENQSPIADKLRFTVDGYGLTAEVNSLPIGKGVVTVDKNAVNSGIG
ncbi:hypothetical protein [Salmonella phage STP-1]|nr:hypothetical protein [Salmonella phage STP-1]